MALVISQYACLPSARHVCRSFTQEVEPFLTIWQSLSFHIKLARTTGLYRDVITMSKFSMPPCYSLDLCPVKVCVLKALSPGYCYVEVLKPFRAGLLGPRLLLLHPWMNSGTPDSAGIFAPHLQTCCVMLPCHRVKTLELINTDWNSQNCEAEEPFSV